VIFVKTVADCNRNQSVMFLKLILLQKFKDCAEWQKQNFYYYSPLTKNNNNIKIKQDDVQKKQPADGAES